MEKNDGIRIYCVCSNVVGIAHLIRLVWVMVQDENPLFLVLYIKNI